MRDYGVQQMIIDGRPEGADDCFPVINPATEDVIAECPMATQTQLDAAVAAATRAFPSWSSTDAGTRQTALLTLASRLEEHAEELARLITVEQGKPLKGFAGKGARFEVGGAIAWCKATAMMDLLPETVVETDDTRVELHRRPLGVVGSITPWNWPLMIAVWHVVPAIHTGNTVVLKPSSNTPLATLRFVEMAQDVLPPGVLNVVTGNGALGRAMTAHPNIAKIAFTGSTPTGRAIMRSASDTLKRLTLELGGNDAGIVLPDVDPAAIAPKIFGSAFSNSGQTCGALKRLYVHENIYRSMCDQLLKLTGSVVVGDGLNEETDFGPLENKAQLSFVQELARAAAADGASFLTGDPNFEPNRGYFFPITLVSDISDGARLVDEEQFGPILPIIPYTDLDEAVGFANNNPSGLGGSVWSSDLDHAAEIAARLECGTAWINGHGGIRPDVPFGGVKQSGFGVEFGLEGLMQYTSAQAMFIPND